MGNQRQSRLSEYYQFAVTMTTVQSTPLQVTFESSPAGGIQYMKRRMKETVQNIHDKIERAEHMEQETVRLKEEYRKNIIRQNKMRRIIYEDEERLEVLERNKKELERRVYEKEEYLRELLKFKTGDSIEEAKKADQKLADMKDLYRENYDKFQKGRQRKISLEQRQEMMDIRERAVSSKLNALTCELHHLKLGKEAKAQESLKTAENAVYNTSEYEKLEANMDVMRKRTMSASQRVNFLTMQVSNKETEIRSMRFNRLEMESTIKSILRKVQEQYKRSQEKAA